MGYLVDRLGRRLNCLLYALFYTLTCASAHFNSYWVLFAGRVCGGLATSILFSAFESWLVCEFNKVSAGCCWLTR